MMGNSDHIIPLGDFVITPDLSRFSDPSTPADDLAMAYELPSAAATTANAWGYNIANELSAVLGFPYEMVQHTIAGNPNTPVRILADAALRFPSDVASNPALPFLLMEDPNLTAFSTLAIQRLHAHSVSPLTEALMTVLGNRPADMFAGLRDVLNGQYPINININAPTITTDSIREAMMAIWNKGK